MTKNRRPTIIDVAREAGVSKSTVSLVLRNSASVRKETRDQVREAMASLGYVYNRNAAQMRTSNTGLVGLVINDLRNPFFTEFAISLQMALAEQGYSTVVANTDETPDLQAQVVGSMIEHGVSAFIICPAYGDNCATFDPIARADIPAMQVLRKVDDRLSLFPFHAPEYLKGSREATRHLLDMGARRIAFAGGLEGRSVTEERKRGYFDVLQDTGMTPLVLTGRSSRDFGRALAHRITRDHPDVDAAICFNDLVALGMISGFLELGREVGKDFRLVGFDDIQDAAQSYPALSSVRCDIARIGSEVAELVVRWLTDGQKPAAEMRTPVTLSIRQSSTGVKPA
ncbi:LacI family DNA-binding transcriptional regulator [Mameliella sediminis]|uniref:LacI family DNA-binding transcriptional regulator n=1 Tax=Mameliella sediminis TaxID=2836866 RepID=UPI001C4749BD|nr:LacI family DNA-binding transcriptional regulator [Mameliella sediminis]MBY6116807.1 LacI family transcriptional regulator [Antarctobacter heliothermus]MBY6146560.1 LacI family transcriptional regulator [Mameliella alba]MBV7396462.1 LacI family transcriptional regulator [Mameliella sediminis]MBY6162789.1 LacI family transcriptional regulator [Mameliella alba]MBY6171052.1 LacI family transcriptional regulator [Mameliella alba]